MGDILTLANKLERAMRNGTGFNVTSDEVAALVADDVVDAVYSAKLRKLKEQYSAKPAHTSSTTFDSTRGAAAPPPTFGKPKLTSPEAAMSYIAALSAGA